MNKLVISALIALSGLSSGKVLGQTIVSRITELTDSTTKILEGVLRQTNTPCDTVTIKYGSPKEFTGTATSFGAMALPGRCEIRINTQLFSTIAPPNQLAALKHEVNHFSTGPEKNLNIKDEIRGNFYASGFSIIIKNNDGEITRRLDHVEEGAVEYLTEKDVFVTADYYAYWYIFNLICERNNISKEEIREKKEQSDILFMASFFNGTNDQERLFNMWKSFSTVGNGVNGLGDGIIIRTKVREILDQYNETLIKRN